MSAMSETLQQLRGGIVVSCQAGPENPLNTPDRIAALALCAQIGGAVAVRVDTPLNIRAVRAEISLPVLAINKIERPGSDVYITPTRADMAEVLDLGCELVAVDGTARQRPGNESLVDLISMAHDDYHVPVMADVDTLAAALYAADCGADLVAPTLNGYTDGTRAARSSGPAFDLVRQMVAAGLTVVVEGRIWSLEDLQRCWDLGAHSVVIGTAITVPHLITARFVTASARSETAGLTGLSAR